MWIEFSKFLLWLYFCTTATALYNYKSKDDYINNQRPRKLQAQTSVYNTNNNNNNYDLSKVRHQSRFPKLENVRAILDSRTSSSSSSTPSSVKLYPNINQHKFSRRRHSGWINNYYKTSTTTSTTTTDRPYEEDYFSTDYDTDSDDEDNAYLDDADMEDDDDLYDSDALFADGRGEDLTTSSTTTTTIKPMMRQAKSSLTDYKWEHFGTKAKVDESRTQHMKMQYSGEQNGFSAFMSHLLRIKKEGQCLRPSLRVIPVQNEHPNPSKVYTPHCTVLHRCADDTGCCKHNSQCQYKSRELVHLYFYTKSLGSSDTKVEKLSFYNHTECECKKNKSSSTLEHFMQTGPGVKSSSNFYQPPENIRRCTCPEHFSPRLRYYSSCSCDCDFHNEDCLVKKSGTEHFGMLDRKCILTKQCGIPVCEYGIYSTDKGRCPRKGEKLADFG